MKIVLCRIRHRQIFSEEFSFNILTDIIRSVSILKMEKSAWRDLATIENSATV